MSTLLVMVKKNASLIGSLNSRDKMIKTETSEVLCSVAGPILLSSNKQEKNKKYSASTWGTVTCRVLKTCNHIQKKKKKNGTMKQPNT